MLYSTVQYGTVQYGTVQYGTVQYGTVQYSTVQYSTVRYSTVRYSTVRYGTVQREGCQSQLGSVHYVHTVCLPLVSAGLGHCQATHNITIITVYLSSDQRLT